MRLNLRVSIIYLSLCALLVSNSTFAESSLSVPDIFIIGTMKGGTTSLEEMMSQHDQICFGQFQEKHYFDGQMKKQAYIKSYDDCKVSQLTLDKTPSYIRTASAPKMIKDAYTTKELAKKKFILILRDPVARMYSEYGMACRYCDTLFHLDHHNETERIYIKNKRQQASMNIKQSNGRNEKDAIHYKMCKKVLTTSTIKDNVSALKDIKFISFMKWLDTAKHISAGQYLNQIENWTKHLPRSQLLVLQFDALIQNTTDVSHVITNFLDLKHGFGSKVVLPKPNYSIRNETYNIDKIVIPELTCQAVKRLHILYEKQYTSLHEYINNAWNKPIMEPFWKPFSLNETLNKCV